MYQGVHIKRLKGNVVRIFKATTAPATVGGELTVKGHWILMYLGRQWLVIDMIHNDCY